MDESANAEWRGELHNFCESEAFSEEGLREIIERHGLTPNNNSIIISDYGFFLKACWNERVNEGVIRYLLEYFPAASNATNEHGWSPLHYACGNPNVTLGIIQLLIDEAPDSVRSVSDDGRMPLHFLCCKKHKKETASIQLLKLFIEKCPEAVRHADNKGFLPIHYAGGSNPPKFCQVLIEAYPGSERMANAIGMLPLHCGCTTGTVSTVDYFYKLYPNAINHATSSGHYPIHCAMSRTIDRNKSTSAVENIQYLLDCDLNVKFQKFQGKSMLHVACILTSHQEFNDSNINAALDVIKALYDAHPEAIEIESIVRDMQSYHHHVQAFINSEMIYARQSKDRILMTTPDDIGRLPLHTALQNNVRLGSIKLLVAGNPHAVLAPDNSGAIPLHIACQHHDSACVVKYLVGLDTSALEVVDRQENTALHYACRGAKYDTIALLLDKFDAVSVSKRNVDGKLPIDVLWESNVDGDSVAYTESVYRLLRAYPETTMGMMYRCNLHSFLSEFDWKE